MTDCTRTRSSTVRPNDCTVLPPGLSCAYNTIQVFIVMIMIVIGRASFGLEDKQGHEDGHGCSSLDVFEYIYSIGYSYDTVQTNSTSIIPTSCVDGQHHHGSREPKKMDVFHEAIFGQLVTLLLLDVKPTGG